MKNTFKTTIKLLIFVIPVFMISINLSAQNNLAYENAKKEMVEQFGTFPSFFAAYPQHALAGAWEDYKLLNSSKSTIPAKYNELIGLAVASQIPCVYCIYFHKKSAKALGATDEEMKEAVAHGAAARKWSMILQASEISLDDFKIEFDGMMKYMSEKTDK